MIRLKLPKEQKQSLIENIQYYFQSERGEEIGELAADSLLSFMIKQLGPVIYNQAIDDARGVVLQQMDRVEEEIYSLRQPFERDR